MLKRINLNGNILKSQHHISVNLYMPIVIMKIRTRVESTPEVLFHYFLDFGKLICLLPSCPESTFIRKLLNGIGSFISIINLGGVLLSFLATAYKMSHERILITEILGFVMIYLETFLNIILWRVKITAFYKFLQEFDDFIKTSKRNERIVINKYFDRYKYFYIFIAIFATISFLLRVIIAPIQGRQKLPFAIYYPFTIKSHSGLHYLIYLSQLIASFQCSTQIIFPITIAMIMLHVSMKLKLLADEIEHAENYNQLIICIQHHQECIKLVERINRVFGGHIMKSYIILGLSIIFGSIKFIYKPDLFTIGRSFLTITSCLIGTYIYNGPADDLYEMSQTIGNSLYDMRWSNDLIKMRNSVMIVIQRVQRPSVISPLKGLMPSLNRKIYASFLSYLISYVMTLRAIVNTQE